MNNVYSSSFVLVALLLTSCVQVPSTTATDSDLLRTEVDGYAFHTSIFGDPNDPPLVVVHGGPGGDFSGLMSLRALADEYHVLFYDQRGTGRSPRDPAENHSVSRFVADLNAIVERHADGEPVRVVGHSWGAMLAAAWASAHPTAASHIVLAEPGALTPEAWRAFAAKRPGPSAGQVLRAIPVFLKMPFVATEDGHERRDFMMTELMRIGSGGPPYQCSGDQLPGGPIQRAGYRSYQAMVGPYMDDPTSWDYDFTRGLDAFEGQILLLSSACSFIGYEWQEQYHRQRLPESTHHVNLENTGHYFFTVHPRPAVGAVRGFLAED